MNINEIFVSIGLFDLVLLASVVGIIAQRYGRSPFGYFLLSLIATPIAGLIVVLCLGRTTENQLAHDIDKIKRARRAHDLILIEENQ